MRYKHAFRPISAGFAAIQLRIQGLGLDQLILTLLYSIFYFHKFFNFCQTNFVHKAHLRITRSAHDRAVSGDKAHLRITRSAHDRAVSGAKSRALYAGKYGI
jgi:hypothetical protein